MEYFLKVSGLIVVFYLVYKTLLQKLTFYSINRWFLIAGIIVSFTFPFIVIPIYQEYPSLEVPVTMFNNTNTVPIATEVTETFDVLDYVWILYASGVSFFAIRFLLRLLSLSRVIKRYKKHKKDGFVFLETTAEQSPFSFFKWIVYNANQYDKTELSQIIAHEKVHAKQYHSIDILFVEISCVVLWFHPFIWLYNKSIKQNLEFLADKYAIHQIENRKSYQYTLLKASVSKHQMALSNHFYNSLIKKRIAMIQKSKSKKINLLKYALVIPVLTLFLMSFNTEEVYVEKQVQSDEVRIIIKKNTSDLEFKNYAKKFKEDFGVGIVYKGIERNYKKEINRITVQLSLTDSLTFSKTQKSINNIEAIEPFVITYNYALKTLDVRDLKDVNENEFKIIINNNSTDSQLKKYKDLFKEKYHIDVLYDNIKRNKNNELISISMELIDKHGKLSTHQDEGTAIKSFVVEYNSATEEMKTYMIKNFDDIGNVSIKAVNNIKTENKPIYIVDGKEVTTKQFKKLNPDDIYKVNVLKGKAAIEKYGDKGKYDVVEIITKKDKGISVQSKKNLSDIKVVEYGTQQNKDTLQYNVDANSIRLEKIPFPAGVLFYVDGKNVSKKEFEKIDPNDVQSISVLKDKQAIDKYGDKGKDGVVEVTLKK